MPVVFLHLFHRIRIKFLDAYQELVLAELDSAVRQELKIAFLALRHAYESAYSSEETTGQE
jgi:DNA adenine methylase